MFFSIPIHLLSSTDSFTIYLSLLVGFFLSYEFLLHVVASFHTLPFLYAVLYYWWTFFFTYLKLFFFFNFWMITFLDRISYIVSFSFNILNISYHSLLVCKVSVEKPAAALMRIPFHMWLYVFSLLPIQFSFKL